MAKRAEILNTLTRARLLELAAAFDLNGLTGKPKAAVVRKLARARRVDADELFAELSRDELKVACRALGLDDGGRAKRPIIDRLLGRDGQSRPSADRADRTEDAPRKARGMAKKRSGKKRPIEQYDHSNERRANNPPVGLVTPQTDPDTPAKKQYQYDPHLDPQLVWAGKAERTSFEVPTVSLHVHERIDPRTIIDAVRARNGDGHDAGGQMPLFEAPDENPPLRDALDFYKHPHNWTNRFIAGDSLLVMNSLLEKEGMAGKVQMVYVDPPYGIDYGSNFQPFTTSRSVRDRDADLTHEPEMIRAFRDTWKLGVHSYLQYLHDRLHLAHSLLSVNGSVFVQIGTENVHRARLILDEVFGPENFLSEIIFRKKMMPMSKKPRAEAVTDYILWYAKDRAEAEKKIHPLFQDQNIENDSSWKWVQLASGERRQLTPEELGNHALIPKHSRVYTTISNKPRQYRENQDFNFEMDGRLFPPPGGSIKDTPDGVHSWSTTKEGMERLKLANRLQNDGNGLRYVLFHDDYPVMRRTALWNDTTPPKDMRYVVETNAEVVSRCIAMATDPGDLVFDPTCGSGTTSYVAERHGRRWIACDTSRVAITVAKQRLVCGHFPYYKLAHPEEGVTSGFVYRTVKHVTRKSVANNPGIKKGMSQKDIDAVIAKDAPRETLYDRPDVDSSRVRVSGPFTVEAVPSPNVAPLEDVDDSPADDVSVARTGATVKQDEWRAELQQAGVRGRGGQRIEFSRIEPLGGTRHLHALGETKEADPKRVVVSFGPEHAPLEQRQVEHAWEEARTLVPKPEMIVFASFQFDSEAAKDIDELTPEKTGMTFLKVQMNADMLTEDLKKKRSSNESFWLIGQPDVEVRKIAKGDDTGKWQVEVHGFDYYNPKKGTIESGDTSKIAMWMLDTDYDGRSLYPRQVFFPMAGKKDGWARLAKSLKAEIDEEKIEAYRGTTSLPFDGGGNKRVAVKIVDDRGIESLKVLDT